MAVVSSLGITFTTSAGNKTVTATPALGDLIVVVAANTGRTTAQPPEITDNNTGGHGTYVLAISATKNTSADSLWVYVRADSIQKAVSTVFTLATASDSGGGLQVFKVTGMSIAALAAVRQTGKQDNQASGAPAPAPAFGAVGLTANPCIGAVFNATSPATMTAPASWSESQDVGYSNPPTGLETAFLSSGNTLQTITWGSNSGSAFCSAVVELDTLVPLVYPETQPRLNVGAVRRAATWMKASQPGWRRSRGGLLVPECA